MVTDFLRKTMNNSNNGVHKGQYDRARIDFPLVPLNKDGSSIYKLGSNIPVQFKGTFANGDPITTGTFTIKVLDRNPVNDVNKE